MDTKQVFVFAILAFAFGAVLLITKDEKSAEIEKMLDKVKVNRPAAGATINGLAGLVSSFFNIKGGVVAGALNQTQTNK